MRVSLKPSPHPHLLGLTPPARPERAMHKHAEQISAPGPCYSNINPLDTSHPIRTYRMITRQLRIQILRRHRPSLLPPSLASSSTSSTASSSSLTVTATASSAARVAVGLVLGRGGAAGVVGPAVKWGDVRVLSIHYAFRCSRHHSETHRALLTGPTPPPPPPLTLPNPPLPPTPVPAPAPLGPPAGNASLLIFDPPSILPRRSDPAGVILSMGLGWMSWNLRWMTEPARPIRVDSASVLEWERGWRIYWRCTNP